jgi:hypothetical protein
MKTIFLHRWLYITVVLLVAVGAGIAQEMGSVVLQFIFVLALPVLTFPLGVLGAICTLPLIYYGIATPSEAHMIAAPVYAIAGWAQWYIVLPRLFGKPSAEPTSLNTPYLKPDQTTHLHS